MSRRRNRRRNRNSKNQNRGPINRPPILPRHPRRKSTISLGFTNSPFTPRHHTLASIPSTPSTRTPSPPPTDSKIKLDITYTSSGRHYSVFLPPPSTDAKVEVVKWDGDMEMQWEHVCPLVLYRLAGYTVGQGEPMQMEWRREPDLGVLVRRARGM
ncbi:hypothetical protein BDD12DRAFT_936349 [Trichophaea hybrida]|nr:hypothetical protein BDD12DRAFT_936349 [Trichophaea hybrida]